MSKKIAIFDTVQGEHHFQLKDMEENNKNQKGKYLGIGIAIGLPIGMAIGIAMDNIAIGPAIGVSLGAGVGIALEAKYNKTEENMLPTGRRKVFSLILIGIIALATAGLLITYFIARN